MLWRKQKIRARLGYRFNDRFSCRHRSKSLLSKKQKMSPDKVLDQIKAAFLKEGPIEGSWISFDTEHMQKFAITMDILSGGITRTEDDHLVAYEFKADAKTGAVLSIDRIIND